MTELPDILRTMIRTYWGETSTYVSFMDVDDATYTYSASLGSFVDATAYTMTVVGDFNAIGSINISIYDASDVLLIDWDLTISSTGSQTLTDDTTATSDFQIVDDCYITITFSSTAVGNCDISSITITTPTDDEINVGTLIADSVWTPSNGSLLYGIAHLMPSMPDDYQGAVDTTDKGDVAYFHLSDSTYSPRGIGYYCKTEDTLMQLHLYGPMKIRGNKIRDEIERILNKRTVRVRPDSEGLLFVDGRRNRPEVKGGYGYVYDLRVNYSSRVIQ